MSSPITIGAPRVAETPEGVEVSYPVGGLAIDELRFTVSPEGARFVDDRCDAALAALLQAAMLEGRTLRIEGPLSEGLVWNVRNVVCPVLLRQLPFLSPIRIEAPDLRGDRRPASGGAVLTTVSGGVDSFSAIQDHLIDADPRDPGRVTHLLFAHIGHHGYGPETDDRAAARRRGAATIAAELDVPLVVVASNTPRFYPDRNDSPFNWLATISVRSASLPLLLQAGARRVLWPSSADFSGVSVSPSGDQSNLDPILLPALGTGAVDFLPVGWDFSRLEKVRRIGRLDVVRRYLDVCTMDGGSNCSRCEKCLRTMLALELTGHLEALGRRFDLEAYRRRRTAFIARVVAERSRLSHMAMRDEILSRGFPLPLSSRARAWALRMWRVIPEPTRRRLRGLPTSQTPPRPSGSLGSAVLGGGA